MNNLTKTVKMEPKFIQNRALEARFLLIPDVDMGIVEELLLNVSESVIRGYLFAYVATGQECYRESAKKLLKESL